MGGEYRRGPALPQLGEGSRTPQPVAANRAPATGPLWRSSQIRRPGSDPAPALYGEHMTERRGDPGFTVATQRLGGDGGPRRSRTRRIGLALVVGASAAIFTIAWLGPRLSDRPSFDVAFFATPTPTATASGSGSPAATPFDGSSNATPLPSITRPDGAVVSGQVPIVTDAFHLLDLATGDIATGPPARFGRDAVFRSATGGGWTCVCFGDGVQAFQQTLIARIIGIDPAGSVTDATDIAVLPTLARGLDMQPGLSTDVDIFDGGRRGILATANREGDAWRLKISPIDVSGRRLGASVELGVADAPTLEPVGGPSGRPGPGGSAAPELTVLESVDAFIDGPHIRVSPDGRVAFVWALVQRSPSDGPSVGAVHAWRIALNADGAPGKVTDAPALARLPTYCGAVGFAAADRLAWLCQLISDDGSIPFEGSWQVGTMDLEGRPAGVTRIDHPDSGYFDAPLFDRANGQIYIWDPTGLTIVRVDVHSLDVQQATFDPLATTSAGVEPGGGSTTPDWHDAESAVSSFGFGTIAGSLDGSRLYALGFETEGTSESGAQPSRGVFAIDGSSLALVDRWAPASLYMSVSALPGGLVAATGVAGVTSDGQFAPWEASLTVHDGTDGRILVRFGQLGNDLPPLVVDH